MWQLHTTQPETWDSRTIADQFGVKRAEVECILELFSVAPAFAALDKENGVQEWKARELLQQNLDWETECLHGYEHVIRITSPAELAASQKGKGRRLKVELTDVSQADLDEMSAYYGTRGTPQAAATEEVSPQPTPITARFPGMSLT